MTFISSRLTAAKRIDIEETTLPDAIEDGAVRLRLQTASLCGTDLHYYKQFSNAGFELQRPVTLGHEACARVVDANGSALAEGQLVAINPIIPCGQCEPCARGEINHCTAKRFPGSATTVPHIDGFFRDMFDVPEGCLHPVDDGIDPDHLTFAEPLACAMHAANLTRTGEGERVLVTGAGPMGLLSVVAAKARGATVHVTDIRPDTVELAKAIGAEAGFVVSDGDARPPGGYDAVIEASGAPQAFNQALDQIRKQGRVVILSNIQRSATPIDLHRIMLKEIEVVGSFQFHREFQEALDLIASGEVDFARLIAARFGVSETGDALALMASGKAAGKILIKPTSDTNPPGF